MLYLIYCESAHYCGYGQHFVVEAGCELDAECLAQSAAEDYFYEQDSEQLEEDGHDLDTAIFSTIVSTEEFGPTHPDWGFYVTPDQAQYYTKVNLE